MQTFLPYKSFVESASCLDYRRLGKQRVECLQLLSALQFPWALERTKTNNSKWSNHPATKMWKGFEECLALYMNTIILEWEARGYKNNMEYFDNFTHKVYDDPDWLGNEDFHASHRSNLLRKDPEWYGKFEWIEPNDLPYVWPK